MNPTEVVCSSLSVDDTVLCDSKKIGQIRVTVLLENEKVAKDGTLG